MATDYRSQGKLVLNTFVKYYKSYNKSSITAEQLYSKIGKYDYDKFLNILGSAYVNGLNERLDKLESAMNNLARESKGAYPSTDSFFERMSDENSTVSLIYDIASASASEIGDGIMSFSKNSLALISFLNAAFPVIVVGIGAYFLYKNKDLLDLKSLKK